MNIDHDPARMIDSTEDRTRVDRKRALAVFALAAIFSAGCGKHRGYETPDAGADESAEAGSGSTKTSESHTSAANGGTRATTTGAAGRQSTGAAGRTGNATGSQRGSTGGGAAGHSASGAPKGGDGGDTSAEPQNTGGAMAPAADGGSGGVSQSSDDGTAGTNAGAGGAADGGDTSSGGAPGSGDVSTGGAGAGATGDVGGAGAGATGDVGGAGAGATGDVGGAGAGATGDVGGAGAGGVGGADNAAGAGAGGAGAGGMSGSDTGGMPAAGSGGSGAMCRRDLDCSAGMICDTNASMCEHCSSDDDCRTHRRYGTDSSCTPDTKLCSASGLCASCGGCEEVQTPNPDTHHTDDPIDYPDPPPTSGPHNPCWATWGVHDMPVPDYRWVHNLEHGGIVYLYNCPDGCADDVATLSQLVMSHPRTVLTSYSKLPSRFAAVAWGHRLLTSCVDVMAFSEFYNENFDHGPESEDAQPDSSCPP